MGLLERIAEARRPTLAHPAGAGIVPFGSERYGHDDSRFSPPEYGDYLVTSADIFSVASLRARLMSGLDLQLFNGRGSEKEEVTSGPAVDLLRHVNPFWTLRRLLRMDELSMSVWGESCWALEPGRRGEPSEIWWAKPSRMRPVPHETKYLKGWLYDSEHTGELIPFDANEVVWFRYPNPLDEFSAVSPLAAARLAADTGTAMMTSNRNLFTNGLQLAGLVVPGSDKVTFSQNQAEELEGLLERRWQGTDRAHRWGVLRYEAKFNALGVTPRDAEFAEGLNLTLRQVCNAYGIPSPLMNDLEHATLANAQEFQRILWSNALMPDAEMKAEEIVEQLLPRFRRGPDHAEFDFSKVPALQESASASWAREAQALDRGALTINEWRKSKGMPPVAWGDVAWLALNKTPVDGPEAPAPAEPDPPGDEDGRGGEPAGTLPEDELAWRGVLAALGNGNGRNHV